MTLAAERDNLKQADDLLKKNPSVAELAAFEKAAAAHTLAVLRKAGLQTTGTK